jgi:hypothetical protein
VTNKNNKIIDLDDAALLIEEGATLEEILNTYGGEIVEDHWVSPKALIHADDGNWEAEYSSKTRPEDAAQNYVDTGEWGDEESTFWVDVTTWKNGIDSNGNIGRVGVQNHTVQVDPTEPECSKEKHGWESPHEVLGGLKENPGVQGHGGGVIITEVCKHCGCYREINTWAQNPSNGVQGLRSVCYQEPDEESLAWINKTIEEAP